MCGGSRRVHERGVALHLLDHLLVFFRGLHRRYAERDDLQSAQIAPLGRQHVVERLRQLLRVAGQRRVTDAHLRNSCKRGLHGRQQLGLELAVELAAVVAGLDVAANVRVEQQRVGNAVGILAEAADGNVNVDTGALIDHAERHRRRRAVLVSDKLLGIEVIDSLILGRFAAEGKTLAHGGEHTHDVILVEAAREDRRLGGGVICILAGFGAHVHDLTLLDDQHTLPVGHGDDRAVCDDVIRAFCVAGTASRTLLTLDGQNIGRQRLAVKILLPLVGHYAAGSTQCSFNQSHVLSPFKPLHSAFDTSLFVHTDPRLVCAGLRIVMAVGCLDD